MWDFKVRGYCTPTLKVLSHKQEHNNYSAAIHEQNFGSQSFDLEVNLFFIEDIQIKAVYAASEQQYSATGGEVQVPCGGIYEWWKVSRGD